MNSPLPSASERVQAGLQRSHALAVQKMFDTIAGRYDRLNRVLSWGIDQRWRARAARVLVESAPPGVLLDLCAGTLDMTQALQQLDDARSILASDFAYEMLQKGRHKAGPQTGLTLADALHLPLVAESTAGVICAFGVRNLSDVKEGLQEIHRVLKPGGLCVVLEFFQPARLFHRFFYQLYARFVLPTVGWVLSGHYRPYTYLWRSMGGFYTRRAFEELCNETGFERVTGEDLTLGVASLITMRRR